MLVPSSLITVHVIALRETNEQLECLYEDAIFFSDDTFSRITGNPISGLSTDQPEHISTISHNNWSELHPTLETQFEDYLIIAGETSWGGQGFVACRNADDRTFNWILHLSTMNNPTKIQTTSNMIRLTTDLNYPHGVDFLIPLSEPEKLKIEIPSS